MTWIDIPDSPWQTNYDKQRNEYFGLVEDMSDKWSYDPEKCDYEYCIGDCDRCPLAEEDDEEEGDEDADI